MKRVKGSDTSHRDTIRMSRSENMIPITCSPYKYKYLFCQKALGAIAKDDQIKILQSMHHNEDLGVIEDVLPRKEKFLCQIIP